MTPAGHPVLCLTPRTATVDERLTIGLHKFSVRSPCKPRNKKGRMVKLYAANVNVVTIDRMPARRDHGEEWPRQR